MLKIDKQIRVAVVDDHKMFRRALADVMKNYGFEIAFEADNGQECIEKISELTELPDVCILDIFIPVMNGFEAARRIKASWRSIKIIACSVNNEERIITEIIAAGADIFLLKDRNPTDFRKAILSLAETIDS
jgi:DNA-binding NarL/FixJ family response regulator